MLLLRKGAVKVEAYGWLAVNGAYPYPSNSPSRSRLATLAGFNRWIRIRSGGVDHLCLPVELRCSSGGLCSEPIADDAQDMRAIQTGMALPLSISSRLLSTLTVSVGSPLPQGSRSDMRVLRVLLCAASVVSSVVERTGNASGFPIPRGDAEHVGFTVDAYPAYVYRRCWEAAAAIGGGDNADDYDDVAAGGSESEDDAQYPVCYVCNVCMHVCV